MIPILHDSNITNRPHICHIILPNQIEILNCLVKLRYSNIVYTHLVKQFLFAALSHWISEILSKIKIFQNYSVKSMIESSSD